MDTEDLPVLTDSGMLAQQAIIQDLRLRLHGSQTQERAARAALRTSIREAALLRRLLSFGQENSGSRPAKPRPVVAVSTPPRIRAVRLTETVNFHLDLCQNHGVYTALAGWAFRPVPDWDAQMAVTTILLRGGGEAFAALTGRILRPDVAAHFAAQPTGAGGARGIAGAGFACEILHENLPAGANLEIVLRLESAGTVYEQPTGQTLPL